MLNTLHVRRAERRWSQRTLAMKAGIGFDRYFRIEKGYTEPTPDECTAIADALQIGVDVAFPPPPPEPDQAGATHDASAA